MKKKNIIVIDLDGTLIKEDITILSLKLLIKKNLLNTFRVLLWATQGKSFLKFRLSQQINIDVKKLTYNQKVINFIKKNKKNNKIVLSTGSYISYAKKINQHIKLFDEVLGTSKNFNNIGTNKASRLQKKFKTEQIYTYIGNSRTDIPIWNISKNSLSVNPNIKYKNIQYIR